MRVYFVKASKSWGDCVLAAHIAAISNRNAIEIFKDDCKNNPHLKDIAADSSLIWVAKSSKAPLSQVTNKF